MDIPEGVKRELDELLEPMSKEMLIYRLFIQKTIRNTTITEYITNNHNSIKRDIVKYIIK